MMPVSINILRSPSIRAKRWRPWTNGRKKKTVSWSEAEEEGQCEGTGICPAGKSPGRHQASQAKARQVRDDMLASLRVWLLMCFVSLMLMLEDDAAMIALIFC
jgi:hypothetical protein